MGKPSPGIELAILSAEGRRLVNEEGDISVLITPTSEKLIFKGYRRGTGGNVKLTRPEKLDKDGHRWYCTGDRGYVDNEGYFWFVGRDDDVFLYPKVLTSGHKLFGLSHRPI
jgi:acyl-coenzyme A synthetase/AMP-(fatty) acid ligase